MTIDEINHHIAELSQWVGENTKVTDTDVKIRHIQSALNILNVHRIMDYEIIKGMHSRSSALESQLSAIDRSVTNLHAAINILMSEVKRDNS